MSDKEYATYFAICEKYGIPVVVHTGSGLPGTLHRRSHNARLIHGNSLHIEYALVKFPKLKIYLMLSDVEHYLDALK